MKTPTNKLASEIKPRDIHSRADDDSIQSSCWCIISQDIAWAIVSACYTRNVWRALTLREICARTSLSAQVVIMFLDRSFEKNGYLEVSGDRYLPTEKFIETCLEAVAVQKDKE
ncbi:MAG: hypothetical protein WC250_04055 [Candidatus Paceibacterota bacterium]|jgi:hypothetical protein